ncbi:MAG: sigma-70 family RNA polymerase sigma factor [Actinobacteria bacterium]|nr:sigma-70 family RNA polymerase sigma factor [Actinomycetota bacterium]
MTVREPSPDAVTASGHDDRQPVPPAVVEAARAGDPDAFMAIYGAYDARLRGLAFRTLGDPDLLDDAMQDVAVKAFLGLPHFRGDCAVGTWLFQITYRTCLNLQRGRGRVVPLPDVELLADDATADPTEFVLLRIELAAALASLTAAQRAVVFLVLEEGLDHQTAARVLGVPPGTVASRLSAARAALVKCLEGPRRDEEMQ